MNDFIAINKIKENSYIIKNNSFFPDIDLQDLRATQNLDGTVTDAKLKTCAITAISCVNLDLHNYRTRQIAAGFKQLVLVPTIEQIDGVSILVHLYLQAVYCHAQALLIERYANFDATNKQIDKTAAAEQIANNYYRQSRYAIHDILSVPRAITQTAH